MSGGVGGKERGTLARSSVQPADARRGDEGRGCDDGKGRIASDRDASRQIVAILSYEARRGILTANATTPYYLGFADISSGPLVIGDATARRPGRDQRRWQMAIPNTEVPGRYLVLGPGQKAPADVAGTRYVTRRPSTSSWACV
jgi:hypothetical protein